MSNSVDPDDTTHYESSHLDLRCLQKLVIMANGNENQNLRPSIQKRRGIVCGKANSELVHKNCRRNGETTKILS